MVRVLKILILLALSGCTIIKIIGSENVIVDTDSRAEGPSIEVENDTIK